MSRPLIYLDQSIVGLQSRGQIDLTKVRGLQWVYSKEHFSEIRRSSNPEQYLTALDDIDAKLLELQLTNWKVTGTARLIEHGTAKEHYLGYLAAVGEVNFNENVFDPFLAWVNGGGSEHLLMGLPNAIATQLLTLTSDLPQNLVPEDISSVSSEFTEVIEQIAAFGNDINSAREALGVGKGAAGSISGKNELLQIWEKIGPYCPGVTSDQFFGFDPPDKQGRESWPIYLGIISCCAVLDVIGFQAEKKSRKIEKIPNVKSDAAHIAMGAYCSAIVSRDDRFSRRAKAIYEYKNIGTASLIISVVD